MKLLLITGTDTDVGKTWVSSLLLRQLRKQGVSVGAYKPVCSGVTHDVDGGKTWLDVDQLSSAIQWTGYLDQICPQRFDAPVAPNIAARLQDLVVDDGLLAGGVEAWRNTASHLLIEGAGGLLCPLSDQSTVADLAERLNAPLLIVAANRLGVINHTLLTVETARNRGLQIAAIVLNDVAEPDHASDESCLSNLEQLRRLLPELPMYECLHHGNILRSESKFEVRDFFK